MKTKFLAFTVLTVLLFISCDSTSFDDSVIIEESINLSKSTSSNNSYIIISKNDKLPNKIEKAIASANGTLTKSISEIGIALVTSNDPDFATNAANIKGIQTVVPNISAQYLDPSNNNIDAEVNYGNPPFSGDDDFFFDLQWGHTAIDAPAAWETGQKGKGVRVAVLDTGFDLNHPDLIPNINFVISKDFTGQGLQYTLPNPFSHGTHTAGTIGAADNSFGTIGIAPEVELVLVKVLFDQGFGGLFDILNGIIYAANVDTDVINMSIGATFEKSGNAADGYSASDAAWYKNIYGKAITYAYQQGTTVITSAGNAATDYDHSADLMHLPSGAAHAVSISATTSINWAGDPNADLDVPASYTNYGQSAIDFAAPGGSVDYPGNEICTISGITRPCFVFDLVFSTGNGGWYWSAGTSMAAPHAAGVAALIIAKNGGSMNPAQVVSALKRSSDDLGKPGNDDFYGAGRVNAFRAVTQ